MQVGDGQVALHIADNGVGIMPADLNRTHTHGLLGMRQRVAAHGGRFDIRRGVPNGTDIHVEMPSVSTATPSVDLPPATPSRTSV